LTRQAHTLTNLAGVFCSWLNPNPFPREWSLFDRISVGSASGLGPTITGWSRSRHLVW